MKAVAFFGLFLMFPYLANSQSKLEKSKKELNAGESVQNQKQQNAETSEEKEHPLRDLIFEYTLGAVYSGLIGNYNKENHLSHELAPYPFYNQESGNYDGYDTIKRINFRWDIEDHFIYSNSNLYGNHLKVKIRPFQYFYLQADYFHLRERNEIRDLNYRLPLFYFNLGYDRLRFEKFNLGWTIGVSYIGETVRKAGLSYGLSAEYFIMPKYSLYGAAKWSSINSRPVNTYEIGGRLHRNNYFVSMGFKHLKIATPTYNFIAIGGGIYF